MIVPHREVLLRKLWGQCKSSCERSQPERSLFSPRTTSLYSWLFNNLTLQSGPRLGDHSVTSADVRLFVGCAAHHNNS
jgi:hypothetical protein